MASSVSTSSKKKVVAPEKDISRITLISNVNKKLLTPSYFPELANIPNIHYITMAIWALESSFQLLRNIGGQMVSRHYSSSETSKLIRTGYFPSPTVKAFMSRTDLTAQQKYNLQEGYYAQGLTGAMGAYFIRGTLLNDELKSYKSLMSRLNVEIDLGQSFTTLFSANDEAAITSSLGQGLVILNKHYRTALAKVFPSDMFKSIVYAVGSYVGKGKDSNGYSGFNRITDITSQNNPKLKMLNAAGIYPTDSASLYSIGSSILNSKSNVSTASTSVGATDKVAAVTNSTGNQNTNPDCA